MKKFLIALAFVAVSLVSNAQLFVAGSISAYHSGGFLKYAFLENEVDKVKENGFSVAPAVGYMIPGKSYGFGLSVGYAYSSVKDGSSKDFTNTFDFGPFFRYAYAKFEKITLYVDAKIPISVADENVKYKNEVVDAGKRFSMGGRLIPGLTYKFTPHILFTTEIGLFSLNYMHTRVTDTSGAVDVTNEFKLGANARQIASFGFVYLF